VAETENLTDKNGAGYSDSDDPQSGGPGAQNPNPVSPGESDGVPDWVKDDPVKAYQLLQEARQEAGKYRQLKQEQEAARKKALEEQGEYKALYEELKAEHDSAAEKLDAYQQKVKGAVEKRLESLPESISTLLSGLEPAEALAWLEAHADEYQPTPRAPQMNAGVTGDRPDSVNLTNEQLQIAQKMGISPEKFAEQIKARRG